MSLFFYDILVYSKNFEDHLEHLDSVLLVLQQNHFFLKASKCIFARDTIEYLGHVVSSKGVGPDPSKVQGVKDWPIITSVKQLRAFLGLSGYYRKFIKGYAAIASPLTDLLQKDKFEWNSDAEQAFLSLKAALLQAPILQLPDFTKAFVIETDASRTAIGAVLLQNELPISYFSKKLPSHLCKQSTYVRELHTVVEAVRKWRQYLLGFILPLELTIGVSKSYLLK